MRGPLHSTYYKSCSDSEAGSHDVLDDKQAHAELYLLQSVE